MSGLIASLALGLLLLIFLLRRGANRASQSSSNDAPNTSVRLRAVPQRLLNRIFGPDDWLFVSRQGSAALNRLFLRQRRVIALSWMRDLRVDATDLLRAHLWEARRASRLHPLIEAKILVHYLLFQMLSYTLATVIQLRGPVELSRWIRYTDGLSNRLRSFTALPPSELATEAARESPKRNN